MKVIDMKILSVNIGNFVYRISSYWIHIGLLYSIFLNTFDIIFLDFKEACIQSFILFTLLVKKL